MVINKNHPIIAWWSGGITSSVACWLSIKEYGLDNIRIVFIDTKNEDSDTYRFKLDCEAWYGKNIEVISNPEYAGIKWVWHKFLSLNVATGAICSTELKRKVREDFQKANTFSMQVFGFEYGNKKEKNRADAMLLNYPDSYPIFPLIENKKTKSDCINIVQIAGIKIPNAYLTGLNNNNCIDTGCVQGGIGYWQLIKKINYPKFYRMAIREHYFTDMKGEPVTMLKDQSKDGGLVFLLPHPDYPNVKDISMMKGRLPKPLMDCNGYCGINDLIARSETEKEINYQTA